MTSRIFFDEYKQRIDEEMKLVREIIKLLDGMKYKDAVAILDCCKNSLELTMVRASEIIMNDENDLAQSHLDEKARQEGDGE